MAKMTRTYRRVEGTTAASMDEAKSSSVERTSKHSPHIVDGERQARPNAGQGGQTEAAASILVDRPSTTSLMAPFPLPLPASAITDAEKAEIITHYAELFCAHMNMKFAATSNRVELLNRQILESVHRSSCKSLRKFHTFYETWYPRRLRDTEDVMNEVGVELNDFEIIQDWWWERCVDVRTQSWRLAFVTGVIESMGDDMDVLELYDTIDELFAEI